MRSGAIIRCSVLIFWAFFAAAISNAQDIGTPLSPVLVIDTDSVFRASRIGQNINADLEAQLEALAVENRTIETELVAEELSLTRLREGMEPAEFRELANAFDQKVQGIRLSQDNKQRDLQQLRDEENQSFIGAITPILSAIGRERGALLILERRSVLLSADTIDITQETIARINAATNNATGDDVPAPTPTPEVPEQPSVQSGD